MIENTFQGGFTAGVGFVLVFGAMTFLLYVYIDIKVREAKREVRKYVRENYKRK